MGLNLGGTELDQNGVSAVSWGAGRLDIFGVEADTGTTRALAGWKGCTTNLTTEPGQFVLDAYHQLWRIEKAFRMSKHDLQARPIYHRTRDSIEAHLSVVFAAMAVSHWIEHQTSWSIKKFVRSARRYRTVTMQAGNHTLIAAEPPPADLAEALAKPRPTCAPV